LRTIGEIKDFKEVKNMSKIENTAPLVIGHHPNQKEEAKLTNVL
jgi:hypothetical protein